MSDQYLKDVLKSQNLAEDSDQLTALRDHRSDVEAILRKKFQDSSPTIRYGGSVAKGTLILESYDLDVICYFKHEDTSAGETLKDIYYSTKAALENDYLIEGKPSALRLKSRDVSEWGTDFHIDVVPGKACTDVDVGRIVTAAAYERNLGGADVERFGGVLLNAIMCQICIMLDDDLNSGVRKTDAGCGMSFNDCRFATGLSDDENVREDGCLFIGSKRHPYRFFDGVVLGNSDHLEVAERQIQCRKTISPYIETLQYIELGFTDFIAPTTIHYPLTTSH